MHMEPLEGRILYSTIPYPAPAAVAGDAIAVVNASPTQVLQTAGDGIANSQSSPDPATLDFIEYHEGLSLYVYPDAAGQPTIGVGLNLNTTGGPTGADTLLAGIGLNYIDIMASWVTTRQLWLRQGHPASQLKTANPAQVKAWLRFVAQNPSVATPLITTDQADQLLTNQTIAVGNQLAVAIGPAFYLLDRDPQTALLDLVFDTGGTGSFPGLVAEIQGNATQATDYAQAAADIPITAVVNSPAANRLSDDRALMRDGEFPTTLSLSPAMLSLAPGDSRQLTLTAQNSRGKNIRLAADKYIYASASPQTAVVSPLGLVTAGAGGLTTVLFSVVDDPAINTTATISVVDPNSTTAIVTGTGPFTITPPGVRAGDTLEVTATLTTSNPDENASGEALLVSSVDSFTTSLTAFNLPLGFSLVAGADGQSLTAQFNGITTGDQAMITARVVTHPTVTFTAGVLSAFTQLSADLNTIAVSAVTTAVTAAPSETLVTASDIVGAQAVLLADAMDSITAGAAPDSNFKQVARAVTVPPIAPVRPSKTMPAALAGALSAVNTNAGQLLATLIAAQTTAARLDGAGIAGNTLWSNRQRAMLTRFNRTASVLIRRHSMLLTRVGTAMQRAALSTVVTSTDVETAEATIGANGLPFDVVQDIEGLGGNAVAVNTAQGVLLAQAASLVDGSLASELVSPSLTADLINTARALA